MEKMKELKDLVNVKGLLIVLTVVFLSVMTACNQDEDLLPEFTDNETVEFEVIADADFDEIDDLVSVAMGFAESSPGARTAQHSDHRFECAEVTHDSESQIITIDFGEGCEGPNGRIRSGKIIITYTGFRFIPGSVFTYVLEDFAIDGRQIEGTRTVENVSATLDDNPVFHITLTGGKITFLDGTVATREVDRMRMWVRASNPINDEHHILEGSTANGVNREGLTYEVTVLETLVYKRNCREGRRFIPVTGVKEIKKGDVVITIDFGDGECDNIVTININGRIVTIEISTHRNANAGG